MAVSWALSSLVKSGLLKSASICARQADDKTQMATNPRNAGRRRATIFIPVLQSPTSGGLPGPQNKKETRAAQGAPPPRFPFLHEKLLRRLILDLFRALRGRFRGLVGDFLRRLFHGVAGLLRHLGGRFSGVLSRILGLGSGFLDVFLRILRKRRQRRRKKQS